ncbi:alpha/beta hydrolase [Nocardia sp. NPDC051832]|uniref:alpha/beta fold hydrolase n=1 Tax=Nocardia sp. NPDC051832 TaxID=3155673 RepID=UPI003412DA6E
MECGDPDGYPVLAHHGVPGCHVEGVAFAHEAAAEVGVRLIAIDRPGVGMSEMAPRQRVLDFAETVAGIADWLEIDQFAVLGASGGGPYTLATAAQLPDRVSNAVVVSSPAPFEKGIDGGKSAGGLSILRRFPFLARPVAARMAKVVRKPRGLDAMIAQMGVADRDRVAGDDWLKSKLAENIHTAFETGSRGVAVDFQVVFARPWGFDPVDIAVPVHIWHGDGDQNVPVADGRRLAATIPNSTYDEIEGAGHLLFVDHAVPILRAILEDDHARQSD